MGAIPGPIPPPLGGWPEYDGQDAEKYQSKSDVLSPYTRLFISLALIAVAWWWIT